MSNGDRPLTPAEEAIQREALAFARAHKKEIARRLTDIDRFPPEERPVSVFMAGSPGAGKTEASIELLEKLGDSSAIRIDPDELRHEFPAYRGSNAWLFQGAVSILVDRIHDQVLRQGQSFILDGTLSNLEKARKNVERSLAKGRDVQLIYVYQQPVHAWEFVVAREAAEGRRIRKRDFIAQYFAARAVVNRLKSEFGREIRVDLLMKDLDNSARWARSGVDQIDSHIPENYSPADLEKLLPPDSEP